MQESIKQYLRLSSSLRAGQDALAANDRRFFGQDLSQRNITRITLGPTQEVTDITPNTLRLKSLSPWRLEPSEDSLPMCPDCEAYYAEILGLTEGERKNRGIVLFWQGQPIGLLKLKGSRSFLALRTVTAEGKTLFLKGMIYALSPTLTDAIESASTEVRNSTQLREVSIEDIQKTWNNYALEEGDPDDKAHRIFQRNNLRFIQDPTIIRAMDPLIAQLEEGTQQTDKLTVTSYDFSSHRVTLSASSATN